MRKNDSSPYELCAYCKKPIEPSTIFKRLESGRAAHLACYTDHLDEEEPAPEADSEGSC